MREEPMSFPNFLLLLAGLGGLGGFLFCLVAAFEAMAGRLRSVKGSRRSRSQELSRRIGIRLEELRGGFDRIDSECAALPPSEGKEKARQLRMAAVDPFARAGEIYFSATAPEPLEEAERLTGEAERLLSFAAAHLDRVSGRVTPGSLHLYESPGGVLEDDCAFCFFCFMPARVDAMALVRVTVDGQKRGVLSCEGCHALLHSGGIG